MMKSMLRKKLRSTRGESIAEVLIALLISTLALMMLATMITSTVKMVNTSKAKMEDYYKQNAKLETLADEGEGLKKPTITITKKSSPGETVTPIETPSVYLYENPTFGEKKTVYAYRIKTDPGT